MPASLTLAKRLQHVKIGLVAVVPCSQRHHRTASGTSTSCPIYYPITPFDLCASGIGAKWSSVNSTATCTPLLSFKRPPPSPSAIRRHKCYPVRDTSHKYSYPSPRPPSNCPASEEASSFQTISITSTREHITPIMLLPLACLVGGALAQFGNNGAPARCWNVLSTPNIC